MKDQSKKPKKREGQEREKCDNDRKENDCFNIGHLCDKWSQEHNENAGIKFRLALLTFGLIIHLSAKLR